MLVSCLVRRFNTEGLLRLVVFVVDKHENLDVAWTHTRRKPQAQVSCLTSSKIQARLLELKQVWTVCTHLKQKGKGKGGRFIVYILESAINRLKRSKKNIDEMIGYSLLIQVLQ